MCKTVGFIDFNNPDNSYTNEIGIKYDEYKKFSKSDKIYYFDLYVKNNKILYFIDKNKFNIISIIGAIATLVFGFISLL